ncbi:MAG: sugar transferase [Proteobacteria bacterium]|nr:sugar transferase [Pseudomonadota bacterium]
MPSESREPAAGVRPARPFSRKVFRGGYSGWSETAHTAFNVSLALVLLFLALPWFILIPVLILLADGRPIFYKGIRLGIHKKPFMMYKFRTLPQGAQQHIGPELLSHRHMMTTPLTKFLRDTRLDELPQLFNILKGDMDFIGPRPVRPEIYQKEAPNIPGYDLRFTIKPGLIGLSQLFTPHSAPKKIRSKIDNRLIAKKRSLQWDMFMVGYTILVVLKEVLARGPVMIWKSVRKLISDKYRDIRKLDRVLMEKAAVRIQSPANGGADWEGFGELIDINEEYFRITTNDLLETGPHRFVLTRRVYCSRRYKQKRAVCTGEVTRSIQSDRNGFRGHYVVRYVPVSPLNQYKVDQYFLKKSLA